MEISSPDEIVQVRHNPVFPDKGMGTVRTAEGNAHHLPPPVDGEGFAEEVSAERAEILSLVGASGPEEGVRYEVALRSPGPTGLENPTTSPDALMSMGVFQVAPPRLGMAVTVPFSQSTE